MDTSAIYFTVLLISIVAFSSAPFFVFSYFKKHSIFASKRKKFKSTEDRNTIAQEITTALTNLAATRKGASIILDLANDVSPYVLKSQLIDAKINANLIQNIFEGKDTPLHDGAIIIKDGRIKFAAVYITRISNKDFLYGRKMGTRHRSILGLSEVSKGIMIVLSEETQRVMVFYKGTGTQVDIANLSSYLISFWNKVGYA